MSGQPNPDEPKQSTEEGSSNDGGVIPVEVEAPEASQASSETEASSASEAGEAAAAAPADPVKELEEKLAAAEKEKKENWDRYLRAAADLENTRKRHKREIEDAKYDTKHKVLKEMLPVVDNLERAIEHAKVGGDTNAILEGVELVLRQFMTAFERLDVTPIDAMGKPFDPNVHEAISQQESDEPAGTVIQVLQRGYRSGDRLLRPSLVVVAKPKAQAE